ncbi:MAG: glutathione S-transferase N-terminal domain-containing protein [Roseiarcus sp.]|jgi:GST-like protein
MIDLYTWSTPNGRKISIMLEEVGLRYTVHSVNIGRDEQFDPKFLAISPNNKIPAIVDSDGPGGLLSLFESGAILTYLAEKTGRFLAPKGAARYRALEWLNWQMGGLGPMFGQLGFFAVRSSEKAPLAIKRFTDEAERLIGVMERRLSAAPYLAGDEYTIADIAAYPWALAATTYLAPALGEFVKEKPEFLRWLESVGERPAVQRGMAIPKI